MSKNLNHRDLEKFKEDNKSFTKTKKKNNKPKSKNV